MRKTDASVLPAIEPRQTAEGYLLIDTSDSWVKVGCLFFIAIFWNAVVLWVGFTVLLWGFTVLRSGGRPEGIHFFSMLLLMLLLFFMLLLLAVVGLLLIFFTIRAALISFRLAPGQLTLSRWPLRLGEEVEVVFHRATKGGARVEKIRGSLYLKERATYTAGTKRHTVTREVQRTQLPEVPVMPGAPATAVWRIRIPLEGPSSFSRRNNSLEWTLKVDLTVAGAPDDNSVFQLLVVPKAAV